MDKIYTKFTKDLEKAMKDFTSKANSLHLRKGKDKPKKNNVMKEIDKCESKKEYYKFTIAQLIEYCNLNKIPVEKKVKKVIINKIYDEMYETESDSDSESESDSDSDYQTEEESESSDSETDPESDPE